ncbi:MAG: alpha/beta hydrolase [Bacteroidales bacterium]|nr:alpha/beta hydrolase [Bacteroidales bacterium]
MAQKKDTIVRIDSFKSQYVTARTVDIWLPPGYQTEPKKRFPVLYMHDGQNLFDSKIAYGGQAWGVDSTIKRVAKQGLFTEIIVVGIWNTFYRFTEYMPEKPFLRLSDEMQELLTEEYEGEPKGDEYLKFLVEELKPVIDQNFRTLHDTDHTMIMGSSMGGLISAYAYCEYPEVFGRAGCLSTHWIGSLEGDFEEFSNAMAAYFADNLPAPGNHKIYFDFGTLNLDAYYEHHQLKIDSVMKQCGYTHNIDWLTKKFPGHDHNEKSWRSRLNIPLKFLAGTE